MRYVLIVLIFTLVVGAGAAPAILAQPGQETYRSDRFGVTFQYPATWVIREQEATHTILAAAEADLMAVAEGRKPAGLLFSLTFTSLRQINARSTDEFGALLARITGDENIQPQPLRLGGADGLVASTMSMEQDLATRTAILSIGRRRVAILRGVATMTGWMIDGEAQFNELVSTLSFFEPFGGYDLDSIGTVLWQLPADSMPDIMDLSVSSDGATLFAADLHNGIWSISANGIGGDITRPEEIGSFGGIIVLLDGSQYISDPLNHMLWLYLPRDGVVRRLVGGQVGTGRGAFGPTSPRYFAFAPRYIYVLDENASGLRIQLLNRGGSPVTFWSVSDLLDYTVETPMMAADGDGNAYILGRNTEGIIKLNAAGRLIARHIGRDALRDSEPLALVVDRFDNFYIATSDQGILHLDADGQLLGVIGEPYDEAAPPKPGQLARPVAIALTPGGGPMYVADMGTRYPQIIAFALDGNTTVNLAAGTREQGAIRYGTTVSGTIDATSFNFIYTFEGQAGDLVTITMRASEGSALDAYIDLLGVDGKLLAANDDARVANLGPYDAQIKDFKLPRNGTYTIRATRFGREAASGEGAFMLTLEATQGE